MRKAGERLVSIIAFAMLPIVAVQAQVHVAGVVQGADGQPLRGVNLRVVSAGTETAVAFGATSKDGRFHLVFTPDEGVRYNLLATRLGFHPATVPLGKSGNMGDSLPDRMVIRMDSAASTLSEIVVRSTAAPFKTKGDTLEYDASRYRSSETRKLEDLLRQMSGFDLAPDGRIRYNGREIDRILIEGEDMTDRNYRLISSNLDAGLIDKVQVLQDFTIDRLMKEVERSGRIGVNITIDSSRRGKVTGTAEAGAGIGGKEWLDNNAIRVGERLKSLAFLRYSETGEASDTDVGYHFNGGVQGLESEDFSDMPKPVTAGSIPLPPMEGTYVRDNRDMGSHLMFNARLRRGVKFRALVGADISRLQNAASGSERLSLPNGQSWSIRQDTRSTSQSLGLIGRMGMDYDRGGKHTGRWMMGVGSGRDMDGFNDMSTGAVADTLVEDLKTIERGLRIHGEHLSKLRSGKILKGGVSLAIDRLNQDFQTDTRRLSGLMRSDSAPTRYTQNLDGYGKRGQAGLSLHGRSGKKDWRLGVHMAFEGLLFETHGWAGYNPDGRAFELIPSATNLNRRVVRGVAALERPLTGKTRISASLQGGYAHVSRFLDGSWQEGGFPLYAMNLALRKRLSLLRIYSVELSSSLSLPGLEHFHPTALLNGDATVRWPVDRHSTYSVHAFRFQHHSNRLSKGREYMLAGALSTSVGAYSLCYERTPALLIAYARAMPSSAHIDLQYSLSQYVRGLKTKMGVTGGAAFMEGRLVYNSTPGIHRMLQTHLRAHAVTAYQGKFNWEASFQASMAADRLLPERGSPSGSSQWSLQGHLKCRLRWSERFYTAVLDRFYLLDPSGFIHAVDLHASLEVPPVWRFSLTGHNLLDVDRLSQRVPGLGSLSERSTALVGRFLQFRVAVDF